MVASGAGDLWLDHELLLELEAKILCGLDARLCEVWIVREINFCIIREIVNFLKWAEIFLRRIVAIEAPAHGVGFSLIDDFHFIDIAMAALAGNPAIHVGRVIEINVVWRLVDSHPLDGLPIVARVIYVHRAVKRGQFWAVPLHMLVAIPARIAARHVGMACDVHERMAIAAV